MTEGGRFVRRNRVDEHVASAIAVAAGVIAAFAGASPTASGTIDVLLTMLVVAAVVWASASAPWWACAVAVGIAAATAVDPLLTVLGGIGFALALWIGIRRRDDSALRAVVGAIAMNVMIRSELGGFLGLSAIIGVAIGLALFVLGVRRRPSAIRRGGWIALGAVAVVAVIGVGAAAFAGLSARPDLVEGSDTAQAAIDALRDGDYQGAADGFAAASASFARVDNTLGGTLAMPARLIPAVSKNVHAGSELSRTAAATTASIATALDDIDPDTLRVVGGAIDIAAIRALEVPLANVQNSLDELRATTDDVRSPWLAGRLQTELDKLDTDLDDNEPRLNNTVDAVRLAPQLLGADGPRRYLVLFTTPVETRGITGLIGNYAVVTADNGKLDVTQFGRRSDLDAAALAAGAACTGCPDELLARYGQLGLDRGDGLLGNNGWTSVTLPAHFPYVGQAAHILFPQSGGQPIDGVIAMDPFVIQALMRYTGPIDVADLGVTVQPDNAAQFLLEDQYLLAGDAGNDQRIEALDSIGQQVITRLLTGSLPVPSTIARDLGPLVDESRLLLWADDPDEQALFDRLGVSGALPPLGTDGGFAALVTNSAHSKIDAFLDRQVDVAVHTDDNGERTLVADVTLTNNAPASGLPKYVIGNDYGFPDGTSWLWLNFFGPPGLESATRGGNPVELTESTEAGWQVYSGYEVLPPGASVHYQLTFRLKPDASGVDTPVVWTQPLAVRPP